MDTYFLSTLPLWISVPLIVILPTILCMCGPVLMRRWIGLDRLETNNEIAGFKFATVGVIYAVLLAFAVIVVWEKFSEAEKTVVQEAGAAATIYLLLPGQQPDAVATRAAMGDYLRLAIEKDWPMMAKGQGNPEVRRALDKLYLLTVKMTEDRSADRAIFVEIFKQLDVMTVARRARLHLSTGVVPPIVRLVLYCGAFLTIAFTFFFGTRSLSAQVLMTGILSLTVFLGLLVMVSIDHPFTGPVHVGNEPLEKVLEDYGHG